MQFRESAGVVSEFGVVDSSGRRPAVSNQGIIFKPIGWTPDHGEFNISLMKIPTLAVLSLLIATASLQAVPTYLSAKVSGTVETQIVNGPADGRINMGKVDNNRIFSEFQVSATDYQLAFSTSSAGLYLVPKHTTAGLPTITVMDMGGSSQTAVDTKSRTLVYEAGVTNSTAANLFQNLQGTVVGSFKYTGAYPPSAYTSATLNVIGHGTDNSGSSGTAILQVKITVKGSFVPVP